MTHIEIEFFIPIKAAQIIGASRRWDFSMIGVRHFLVTAVEPHGRTIMWDGDGYEDAIVAAQELAASYECEVHDLVGGPATDG